MGRDRSLPLMSSSIPRSLISSSDLLRRPQYTALLVHGVESSHQLSQQFFLISSNFSRYSFLDG